MYTVVHVVLSVDDRKHGGVHLVLTRPGTEQHIIACRTVELKQTGMFVSLYKNLNK